MSLEKLKKVVFNGEKKIWKAFKMIVERFLENHRRDDYVLVISNVISAYERFVCRMSLNLHFYTLI